jgi:hypothetical protein
LPAGLSRGGIFLPSDLSLYRFRTRMKNVYFVRAALVLAALLAITLGARALPQQPIPEQAFGAAHTPNAFSAGEALGHLRALAQKPRPIASEANAEARSYLLTQLRALGLEPQVQSATVEQNLIDRYGNARVTLAVVQNIVVRLPGAAAQQAPRSAVLLATRYDSANDSVGASAAAPAAALLETLRVLQAAPALNNDVICLFADGEQIGHFGSRGFAEQHRWASQVGMVLKFDSGGSDGPVLLTDTAGASGDAVQRWASVAARPLGSSFMRSAYALGLSRVGMGPLHQVGVAGLEFANVEANTGTTGALDTVERFDRDTLQDLGDTMLSMTRAFATTPVKTGGQRVYFNLPGLGLVHYSAALTWPLTVLIGLLFVTVARLAIRREGVTPSAIALGGLTFVLIAAAMVFAVYALWQFVPAFHPASAPEAFGTGAADGWYLFGFVALASAVFIVLQRAIQNMIGAPAAQHGVHLCLVILLVIASARYPAASFILSWPLLATLTAFGALTAWPEAARYRPLILLAAMLPAAALIVPLLLQLYSIFSPEYMMLPVAVLAVLLGFGSSLLAHIRCRFVARSLMAGSLACMTLASTAQPYGAAPLPQPNRMTYYADTASWKSYWLLPTAKLDNWSRPFFSAAAAPRVPNELFGTGSPKMWITRAPNSQVAYPQIEITRYSDDDRVRHIEFVLKSRNAAPAIELTLNGIGTRSVVLNGRSLNSFNKSWRLTLYGMRDADLHFSVDIGSGPIVTLQVNERIPGLPGQNLGEAPGTIPLTATTISSDTLRFD